MKPTYAFDYLAAPTKYPPPSVCVVYGDESFLVRLALATLRRQVLGAGDAEFSLTRFEGNAADFRSVVDELATVAMFGDGRRMVVVDDADDFVSRHRSQLEDYVAAPKTTGVLVLSVKSWPGNTRLYKAVAESGLTIECKPPGEGPLLKWLVAWAKKQHQATLQPAAAELLVETIGIELGMLDQELAKLSLLVPAGQPIDAELVGQHVVGWRAKTAWDMIDAAAAGDARTALAQLDRLLLAGDQPVALLGQMASTLRRFAAATRLVQQAERAGRRVALRDVLAESGFKPFILAKAESQLKQIGRRRAARLYQWLLDADLAIKGASSSPSKARLVLEQLVVRLSTVLGQTPRSTTAAAARQAT